jgi:chorismate dehydratase
VAFRRGVAPLDAPAAAGYRRAAMNSPRSLTTTVAARIPYANCAPFYALWADAPFAVRNLEPRDLGREAESGGVDLGVMAAGDWFRMKDRFELLAPMGVAARGPVQSVLLFSRRPASALEGARISVTPATSTSVRLLHLLLDVRRDFKNVSYVRGLEPAQADAMLMIGDQAMRTRKRLPEGFTHVLDLGEDWLSWTGLPFVYAVWVVRSALDPALKAEMRAFLEASLAAGLATLPEVARITTDPGWTAAETEAYLRQFHYRFGPDEMTALERFESLVREHGLLVVD